MFSFLKVLISGGFSVTFVPLNLQSDGRYTQALRKLGITTLSAPEWPSIDAVIETFAPLSDVLLLYREASAKRVLDIGRRAAPAAKILFHPVDLHFLRMERAALLVGDQAQFDAAQAMRATELDLIARSDATIVVSRYEFDLLQKLQSGARLHHIPILRDTPLRSSAERWRWIGRDLCQRRLGALGRWINRLDPGFAARRDLLFIGGYEHSPNVDAVKWFARAVWPAMQSRGFPDKFIIAGSHVPDELAKLASDRIEVRGYVEDLAGLFAACRLSVAPLRYGGGIKGKIVTSLSYGVPVVATSIASEGMGLQHEENILVADSPDAMADQIVRLYDDADLWQRLSSNGYEAFQDEFSLAAGAGKILGLMDLW